MDLATFRDEFEKLKQTYPKSFKLPGTVEQFQTGEDTQVSIDVIDTLENFMTKTANNPLTTSIGDMTKSHDQGDTNL